MILINWECNGHKGQKTVKTDRASLSFAKKLHEVFMTSEIKATDGTYAFLKVEFQRPCTPQQK